MTANKASAHVELDPDFEANSTAPINFIPYLHYELRSRLGKSAMSEVYEAWDTKLCRAVAIKKLKNNDNSSPDNLVDEARTAASLQHAAFIKIHAIEDDDEGHSIVMELAHGTSLKDWIKLNLNKENPENNEARALGIVAQIAEALQEAHAIGLIHGDLKPVKLLIDNAGKIRILDIGLASNNNPNTITTVGQIDPAGSIAYMAPERFANPTPSAASDIYALGTILYEILTGSPPFATLNGLALIAAQVQSTSEQWPWPSTISAPVRQLIQAMTTRQPDQRLSSAQVVEECKKLGATEPHSNSAASINLSALQAELANTIHQQKKRKFVIGTILALVLTGITAIGAWQAKPYWPQIVKALTPYSEAREMELGMAALEYHDRPGMLDVATKHFANILERNASNAKAVAAMSITYGHRFVEDSRDEVWREKAFASAQQAIKLDPNLAISQIAYARVLNPHQDFDLAITAVRRARQLDPNNLLAWKTELRILLLTQKHSEMLSLADVALRYFPSDSVLHMYKGILHLNQRRFQLAEQSFRASIANRPDSDVAYGYLCDALRGQERFREALQVLQQGLQIRPKAHLYLRLGIAKYAENNFAAAATTFEKATSPAFGNPQDYEPWYWLGESLVLVSGRESEAFSAFEKARELFEVRLQRRPSDGWYNAQMGRILARLGKHEKAEELVKRALLLAPKNQTIHRLAAIVYELGGKREYALLEIDKATLLGETSSQIQSEIVFKNLLNDPRYKSKLGTKSNTVH